MITIFLALARFLKIGSREQSSNGLDEQIVFDPHSEGKCADLSPE